MQKLAEVCIRRPVFASMLILAMVVVGGAAYMKLAVDRFPSIDLPTVRISTRLPGASPTEVETEVSQLIEENVNTVQGIRELRSISGVGSSFVIVTFNLDRDIDEAAQDVRDRVAAVARQLPKEADPPVITKFDNDLSPVLTMALAGDRSLRELTELADKIVKPQLERSPGVGEIEILGGLERAINIWVNADRLAAYGMPVTSVRDALMRQNSDIPGGNITSDVEERTLRTLGRLETPEQFNDLVIVSTNGSPVRIRDIGLAEDGTKEERTISRLNGTPTVSLVIRRQSGENTVAVIEGVKKRMAALAAQLPPDVRLEIIQDESDYIYSALHEITVHLVLGSILASLVVLIFMRNWRATVIASVAIPCSVIATFAVMKALHFTLNSVTMLALVLMVGVVIDDAIVVLENIFRWIEEKGLHPFEAAREATQEIGLAVMATTLSLVVIFVPVSFMSSISGRFLFQFGITAAVAVLVSLIVSFTLTPMMSARFFRSERGGHTAKSRGGFYARLENFYLRSLSFALRHRLATATLTIMVIASSVPLYKIVRQEYTPGNVDEGEFEVRLTAPEGASLPSINTASEQIEHDLRGIPGVRLVLASAGGNGFMGAVNYARFFVRLIPHDERLFTLNRLWAELKKGQPWAAFKTIHQRDVMIDVRQRLKKYTGLRTGVNNVGGINIGGPGWDIDFVILGPDLEKLASYAEELRKKAPDIGIIDVDTTLKLDKPELKVVIDRDRAAALGVATDDIASALRIMVGGEERASRFYDPSVNDSYDVQVRLQEDQRRAAGEVARLFVPKGDGGLVRLDNLVKLVPGTTASRIDRLDRQRQVSVRGGVAPGYAMADRLEAISEAAKELNMPPGYTTRVAGKGRELDETFREFLWAFLLSVIFMYMILASQFESIVHPFTILLSLPICVPFALFSLWITGSTLNLYSALGLLVLFGVVKKNAILQIDHMINLERSGLDQRNAILQANRDRLRPILMTTLTLVAGMLPLALGNGPGAEERRSIAMLVIGGQSLALFLTLIVTPVAYSFFEDLPGLTKSRRPKRVPSAIPEAELNQEEELTIGKTSP
ncbi:MAG TPA: efflux RND transporter permease subunit [Verrucomicrobiae bacterium]|nr:efflux RND transporter permease subunit [Verrucomicrobiae bacterium]